MLFYWCVFLVIWIIALQRGRVKFALISAILMFLGATRATSVGADLRGGYTLEFNSMLMDPSTWGHNMSQFEFGFSWIMAAFKTYISSSSIYFFQLVFVITFACLILFVKKNSKHPALVMVFMFSLSYYFSLYNIMRQELCFSLICLVCLPTFIDYYEKKENRVRNSILSIAGIFLFAILFHNSQVLLLLCIPLCILRNNRFLETKYLIICMLVTMFFSMTIAQKLFSSMSSYAHLFTVGNSHTAGYMEYSENIGRYSTTANMLNTLFAIFVVYMHRFKKDVFLLFFVLGVCMQNSLTPISWIFARLANTFLFFRIFVLADLWYEIPNRNEKLVYRIVVAAYTLMMFNNRLINDRYTDVVPYVNHYLEMLL